MRCQHCNRAPAAEVRFIWFVNIIFVGWQIEHDKGIYCTQCALTTHRACMTVVYLFGWWGIGSIISVPLCYILNRRALKKVERLGPTEPYSAATFVVGEDRRAIESVAGSQPLNPGRQLRQRVSSYLILLVLAVTACILYINR